MVDDEFLPQLRERMGSVEFVVNLRHLPIVVETWFGGPTTELIDRYSTWLEGFLYRAAGRGQQVVFLHDATRAGMPDSAARQRLTQIPNRSEVILDRVIVFDSPVIRSAVLALGWVIGSPYKTAKDLRAGVEACRGILDRARVEPPPAFELRPEQPSR